MPETLTLTDVMDRIRAIKADTDILQQACWQIAFPQDETDPEEKAHTKIMAAVNGLDTVTTIRILTESLAAVAVHTAEPGHEVQLLGILENGIATIFMAMLQTKMEKQISTDPDAAFTTLRHVTDYVTQKQKARRDN